MWRKAHNPITLQRALLWVGLREDSAELCLTWRVYLSSPTKSFWQEGIWRLKNFETQGPSYSHVLRTKLYTFLKSLPHVKLAFRCHYCAVRSEQHAYEKLHRNNSSKSTPGQEKQIFMGFVLNLQSQIHKTTDSQKYYGCREAGEQFMSYGVCPQLNTRSNTGSQQLSRRAERQ